MAITRKLNKRQTMRKRNKGGQKRSRNRMSLNSRHSIVVNPERHKPVERHTKKIKLDIDNLIKMASESSKIAESLSKLGDFFDELAMNEWGRSIWTSEHQPVSHRKNINSNAQAFSQAHIGYKECMERIEESNDEAHALVVKSEKLQELTGKRNQGTLKAVFEEMKHTEIDFFANVRLVVDTLRRVIALCKEKALLDGLELHTLSIHGSIKNTPYASRTLYDKIKKTSSLLEEMNTVISKNIILLGLIKSSENDNFQNEDETNSSESYKGTL